MLSATNIIAQPLHLPVIALSGRLSRDQQALIDSFIEEKRVLKNQLEGRRPRFTDEQRLRLAVKANVVGRQLRAAIATLVAADARLAPAPCPVPGIVRAGRLVRFPG